MKPNRTLLKTNFLAIILTTLLLATTFSLASIHVGYRYYQNGGWPPPNGVAADIKTINKDIPYGYHFYTQSVSVWLSATHGYWLQVGYYKGYSFNYQLKWYVERKDSTGGPYHYWQTKQPTAGSTYHYYLDHTSGGSRWDCGVNGKFNKRLYPSPYTARNYEGMSEMTTNLINIDGTYYKYLYYAQGSDWRFWDRHYPVNEDDIVYWLNEISHYRFKAGGGGE